MTATTSAPQLSSHRGLLLPTSTSEAEAMVRQMNKHHTNMYGDVVNIAAFLRSNLPDAIETWAGRRRGLGGLDTKMAARKIARPLEDIASLDRMQAKLWLNFLRRWQENAVNLQPGKTTRAKIDLGH